MATYWSTTRAPRYSLTFALPLLILYELLARRLSGPDGSGIRNGADVLLKSLFVLLGGGHGLTVFGVLLLGTGLLLVWRDRRKNGPIEGRYFVGMLAESVVYAVLFGVVTSLLTSLVLQGPRLLALGPIEGQGLPTQVMVSLGAGIYEELLFRVLIVGALARFAIGAFQMKPFPAGVFATLLGAVIFAAFHYVGPLGDSFELTSFTFRTIAGVLLSALYLVRGFGITAWTHALYDVLLTVAR